MDPFGPDGLSDEIVLNILAHIPDASTYLCFSVLSRRLHDLCIHEENRSSFWRIYYATEWHLHPLELQYYFGDRGWRERFVSRRKSQSSLRGSSQEIGEILYKVLHTKATEALLQHLKALSAALSASRPDWVERKKLFYSSMGLGILTSLVAAYPAELELSLTAMRIMFLLMRDSAPEDKSYWPPGCITVFGEQLSSSRPDNRRVALGLLWLLCCADDSFCSHFGELGAVEPIIKLLYAEQLPPIMCSISILAKCDSEAALSQMFAADILPRVVQLLSNPDYAIKAGAMRIISKFEPKRVGELNGVDELLKIIQENHDKVESISMMALVVLENLAADPSNQLLMGKDDTISAMAGLIAQSEKSEIQKQAMDVICRITKDIDVNARRFRQLVGLDGLLAIVENNDFPDVLSSALRTIVVVTWDLNEYGNNEASDVIRQLSATYPKLVGLVAAPSHHKIVHEAACGCLAALNKIVPVAPALASEMLSQVMKLYFTTQESTTIEGSGFKQPSQWEMAPWVAEAAERRPNLDKLLLSSLRLLGSVAEVCPSAVDNCSWEVPFPRLAEIVLHGFLATSYPRSVHYLYPLVFLLQSDSMRKLVFDTESVYYRLSDLVESCKASDPTTAFLAALAISYVASRSPPASSFKVEPVESFITSVSYSTMLSFSPATLAVLQHLLVAAGHATLQAFGCWLLAHLSQSYSNRRKIKSEVSEETVARLRAAVSESDMSAFALNHLSIFDKFKSMSSMYS